MRLSYQTQSGGKKKTALNMSTCKFAFWEEETQVEIFLTCRGFTPRLHLRK